MAGWDQLLAARGIDVPNPIDLEKSRLTLGQMSNANALTGLNLDILRNTLAMQRDPAYPKYISALMSLASGGAPSGDASKIAEDLFTRFPMQGQNGVQQVMTLAKNAADIAKSRTEADKDAATAAEKRLTTLANTASAYATQKAPVTPAQAQRFVMNAQFFGHPEMVAGLPEAFTQGPEATKQWFADFAAAGSTPAQQATIAETTGRTALQNPQFQLERVRAATAVAQALGAQIKEDKDGNMLLVHPNGTTLPLNLMPDVGGAQQAPAPATAPQAAPPPRTPERRRRRHLTAPIRASSRRGGRPPGRGSRRVRRPWRPGGRSGSRQQSARDRE